MPWLTKTFISGVLSASDLRQFAENYRILDQHSHASGSGDGAANLKSPGLVTQLTLWPRFPSSQVGQSFVVSTSAVHNFYAQTSNQNDEANYPVALAPGQWTLGLICHPGPDQGIMAIQLNGVQVAVIDLYAAGASFNQHNVVGLGPLALGQYTLRLLMSSKNAASSNYGSRWSALQMRRVSP